jgi:hypothetical protein
MRRRVARVTTISTISRIVGIDLGAIAAAVGSNMGMQRVQVGMGVGENVRCDG